MLDSPSNVERNRGRLQWEVGLQVKVCGQRVPLKCINRVSHQVKYLAMHFEFSGDLVRKRLVPTHVLLHCLVHAIYSVGPEGRSQNQVVKLIDFLKYSYRKLLHFLL